MLRPKACARAVTPSQKPFVETYVSGPDAPASWNWLRYARSASSFVSNVAVTSTRNVGAAMSEDG